MIVLMWIILLTVANILYLKKYREFKGCLKYCKEEFKYRKNGIVLESDNLSYKSLHKRFVIEVPYKLISGRRHYTFGSRLTYNEDNWRSGVVTLLLDIKDIVSKSENKKDIEDVK